MVCRRITTVTKTKIVELLQSSWRSGVVATRKYVVEQVAHLLYRRDKGAEPFTQEGQEVSRLRSLPARTGTPGSHPAG